MRNERLMAKDKAPRKVAKNPGAARRQAGSRQSRFVQGRVGRKLTSFVSSEVSVGPGSKKAVGDAGGGLS